MLAVTYYDFRRDDSSGELTDQFALFCNPASSNCGIAASWGREKRLTPDSFDMLDAPVAARSLPRRLHGLGISVPDVHPAYGIADGADETNIVTRKLTIAPAVASAATN